MTLRHVAAAVVAILALSLAVPSFAQAPIAAPVGAPAQSQVLDAPPGAVAAPHSDVAASFSIVPMFLRADLLGKRVRVTNIEPGMSDTNFSTVRFKGDAARADKVYEGTKPLSADDVAQIIHWVNSVPAHVNINTLEVMPTCQAWSALGVNRNMEAEQSGTH